MAAHVCGACRAGCMSPVINRCLCSFTPRLRTGGDGPSTSATTDFVRFRSTPPHGRRPKRLLADLGRTMFRSTPPHGRRLSSYNATILLRQKRLLCEHARLCAARRVRQRLQFRSFNNVKELAVVRKVACFPTCWGFAHSNDGSAPRQKINVPLRSDGGLAPTCSTLRCQFEPR